MHTVNPTYILVVVVVKAVASTLQSQNQWVSIMVRQNEEKVKKILVQRGMIVKNMLQKIVIFGVVDTILP